jgi:pimeloyl-ACP methyl ester carboxylesterase
MSRGTHSQMTAVVARNRSRLATVAAVVVLALFCGWHAAPAAAQSAAPSCDWTNQPPYTDFYAPPPLGTLTPDRLGEILRVEHRATFTPEQVASAANVPVSLYGAEVYRILYLSQDRSGNPEAVSGLILVPTGTAPSGGYPVIIDGHSTTGAADECAPSRCGLLRAPVLMPYVASGYVVVATDYEGLGTPGPHPYGIGESAARSLLDSGRAALRFCDTEHNIPLQAANQMLLEGHSQGGQGVLFAEQFWPTYAPELNILGTIAFAPGAEPAMLAETMAQANRSVLVGPITLAMYSMSYYYGAPADITSWLQEPYASEAATHIESECIIPLSLWLGFDPSRVFQPNLLAAVAEGRWDDIQPWKIYMDLNTPGNFRSDVPVLIIQGTSDPIVPMDVSVALKERLCSHGTPTELSLYPDRGHNAPSFGMPEALYWAGERLAGIPPTGVCPVVKRLFLPLVFK